MTSMEPLALDGGAPLMAHDYSAQWPPTPLPADDLFRIAPAALTAEVGTRRVARLERHWRNATSRTHAVACRSGDVALRMIVTGLELDPGDEVICPADAALTARVLFGASVVAVPVDLDPRTLQLDPDAVRAAITDRTRAVVVVDRHGSTADYDALAAVCDPAGIALIEDASESLGATYHGRPAGAHGMASFCSVSGHDARSPLGTSGLFATDDEDLIAAAQRMLLVNNDTPLPGTAGLDPESGGHSRMTGWSCQLSELDAVLAHAQLRRNHEQLGTRVANGSHLCLRLADVPGVWTPEPVDGATNVYTSLPLLVVPDELGLPEDAAPALRDAVVDALTAEGLWIDSWRPQGSNPMLVGGVGAQHQAWRVTRTPGRFAVSEALAGCAVVLGHLRSPFEPPHTTITMDAVADCFEKVLVENVDRLRQLTVRRFEAQAEPTRRTA
ncbi:MAG: DegT/DnrJ/EryC1/StrS family aminotransferase [Actinomycetota bacterium]